MLHTFTPNKSCAYLLNIEPKNLVFLKTYKTALDGIIIAFTDQNSRPLEMEDKVNLLVKLKYPLFYRTKNKKICQRIWIFVVREKSILQIWKNIIGCC